MYWSNYSVRKRLIEWRYAQDSSRCVSALPKEKAKQALVKGPKLAKGPSQGVLPGVFKDKVFFSAPLL